MPAVPKPSQVKEAKKLVAKPKKAKAASKPRNGRAARHPGVPLPKDGASLSLKEASARLGVTVRKVIWLAGKGQLIAHIGEGKTSGIDPKSVAEYQAARAQQKAAKSAVAS